MQYIRDDSHHLCLPKGLSNKSNSCRSYLHRTDLDDNVTPRLRRVFATTSYTGSSRLKHTDKRRDARSVYEVRSLSMHNTDFSGEHKPQKSLPHRRQW